VPTPTLLDVARVIAGCKLFVGNQSSPRAIAEGLKIPVVVEKGRHNQCHFARHDAWYDQVPPAHFVI
jgi:ADP-heptose:LPS heptosyltransferase